MNRIKSNSELIEQDDESLSNYESKHPINIGETSVRTHRNVHFDSTKTSQTYGSFVTSKSGRKKSKKRKPDLDRFVMYDL